VDTICIVLFRFVFQHFPIYFLEYGSDEYTGQQKSTDFLGKAKSNL